MLDSFLKILLLTLKYRISHILCTLTQIISSTVLYVNPLYIFIKHLGICMPIPMNIDHLCVTRVSKGQIVNILGSVSQEAKLRVL